jgi:hypothetical protein
MIHPSDFGDMHACMHALVVPTPGSSPKTPKLDKRRLVTGTPGLLEVNTSG